MQEKKVKGKKRGGGKQPGAGRPKGRKNNATIEREAALEAFKNGVTKRANALMNVQTMLAFGTIKVFRIETEYSGSGKNRKATRKKPVLVSDDEEIINALDYTYGDGESPNDDETYYFVTTKDPENNAINSLLDRTFGKPKEQIAIKHTGLSLKELYEASQKMKDEE